MPPKKGKAPRQKKKVIARREECRTLHNIIASVIVEMGISAQDALYVLKLLESEIIESEKAKLFQPPLSRATPKRI